MRSKAYRVRFLLYHPKFGVNPTKLTIKAKSEEEVPGIITKLHPVDTEVLSTREISSWDEYALEIFWQAHPELYLKIWEPDMTTKEMMRKFKQQYPAIWEGLSGNYDR